MRFGFTDLPKWETDTLLIRSSRLLIEACASTIGFLFGKAFVCVISNNVDRPVGGSIVSLTDNKSDLVIAMFALPSSQLIYFVFLT